MKYSVEASARFKKEFKKLDHYTQKMIKAWITKHLQGCDDPKVTGKALTAKGSGLWRYRIGDYRLICWIEEQKLLILALTIGHRRDIYKNEIK